MSNQTLYEAMPFERKVMAMRNAQKEYFKTRSIDWLKSAKMFEALVDKEIEQIENTSFPELAKLKIKEA